jgi:hypothetical protein
MKKVPDLLNKIAFKLGNENSDVIEKALTNADSLTRGELGTFKEAVGAQETADGYSVDEDILKEIWDANENELKEIYGDFEKFSSSYVAIIESQMEGWADIDARAEKLGFDDTTLTDELSRQSAKTWTNVLEKVLPTGSEEGADAVNTALYDFLDGYSQEQRDAIMSQIG